MTDWEDKTNFTQLKRRLGKQKKNAKGDKQED